MILSTDRLSVGIQTHTRLTHHPVHVHGPPLRAQTCRTLCVKGPPLVVPATLIACLCVGKRCARARESLCACEGGRGGEGGRERGV